LSASSLRAGHLHPVLAAIAVLCIAVGAGASGAINMWYDRDIDAVMRRTAGRPLPAGRMLPARRSASARCWRSVGRGDGAGGQLGGRRLLALTIALLRLRLHDLAEAPHAAEHRDRRAPPARCRR
jgi:hypothetical protein